MPGPEPEVPTPRLRTHPTPPGDSTGGHGTEAPPTRLADAASSPQKIGPYAIVQPVGRGGMGTVYLARDTRDGREVALKVIPAGPDADPTDLARFRMEGQAVTRLNHPNIVRVFDVDEADGQAYIAMEYVPGGTLYRRITRGTPIDPLDAARITEALARATHYAHQHGVIHRDLKPSNILLANAEAGRGNAEVNADGSSFRLPGSEFRDPKITDFGLARQLNDSPRLTRAGTAVGTPHYMAPEQARGEDQVGPAIDVHGLGTILYEMLTGNPPFNGNTPAEIMDQVVHKVPTAPGQIRAGIPPGLEAICQKCLEKNPRHRYRTAAALAADLRRFIDDPTDATLAIRVQDEERAVRAAWLAGSAGVAVLAAALAVAVTLLVTRKLHRDDVQTHQDRVAAHREQAEAAGRAERRARLETAIHLCERGQVSRGLEMLRALEGDPDLPVREVIAAWQGRVLTAVEPRPEFPARVAAFHPAEPFLVTAAGRNIVRVDSGTWQADGDPWEMPGEVTALSWGPDGRTLAVGTADGQVLLGDSWTGEVMAVATDLGKPVAAVAAGETATWYLLEGGDQVRVVGGKGEAIPLPGPLVEAAVNPHTGAAAIVLANGTVRVYDPADGHWHPLPPDGEASAIAFATDGNLLAVGTRNGAVRLWDAVARVAYTEAVPVARGPIQWLAVGAAGTEYRVLAGTSAGPPAVLRCGRPFLAPPIRPDEHLGAGVLGVSFATGRWDLIITSPSGVALWLYDPGGRYLRSWLHPADRHYPWLTGSGRFAAAAASPPAAWAPSAMVVGGTGGRVIQMSPHHPEPVSTARVETAGEMAAVAVGPAGQVSTSEKAGGKAVLRHWPAGLGGRPTAVHELPCAVCSEAFLPDGSAVVLGCEDGQVRLWAPQAGGDARPLFATGTPILALAVSPDGRRILAGGADGTARLWDRETGTELRLVHHGAEVRGVAFVGPDLLTAGADGAARRWHAATGLPLGPPLRHPDALTALSVWGNLAATGGRAGYVRVWRVR